jgi:XTP/dITP diphosphohydrolase
LPNLPLLRISIIKKNNYHLLQLIFATNNKHKADEIRGLISSNITLLTLTEAGINIDIPEPYNTLEENATTKSRTIFEMTGTNCFSEDTGLEVAALNGEPGVKSARYAGDNRSFDANIEKLLFNLAGKSDRSARFRTVISLLIDGTEVQFEGVCEGQITLQRRGEGGFGYDPVFIPVGSTKTFGQMSLDEKGQYSHRARATEKLVAFLNTYKLNH